MQRALGLWGRGVEAVTRAGAGVCRGARARTEARAVGSDVGAGSCGSAGCAQGAGAGWGRVPGARGAEEERRARCGGHAARLLRGTPGRCPGRSAERESREEGDRGAKRESGEGERGVQGRRRLGSQGEGARL
jgi:hypothetical protein